MPRIELPPEMIADLRGLGTRIQDLERELERAKRAGLDMSDLEARLTELKTLRQGLLNVYGRPKQSSQG